MDDRGRRWGDARDDEGRGPDEFPAGAHGEDWTDHDRYRGRGPGGPPSGNGDRPAAASGSSGEGPDPALRATASAEERSAADGGPSEGRLPAANSADEQERKIALASSAEEEEKIMLQDYSLKREVASEVIGNKLLSGYVLTHIQCEACQMPLMERDSVYECVVCPIVKGHAHRRAEEKLREEEEHMRIASRGSEGSDPSRCGGDLRRLNGAGSSHLHDAERRDPPEHHYGTMASAPLGGDPDKMDVSLPEYHNPEAMGGSIPDEYHHTQPDEYHHTQRCEDDRSYDEYGGKVNEGDMHSDVLAGAKFTDSPHRDASYHQDGTIRCPESQTHEATQRVEDDRCDGIDGKSNRAGMDPSNSANLSHPNAPEQHERTQAYPSHCVDRDEKESSGQHIGNPEYQTYRATGGPEFDDYCHFQEYEGERFCGNLGSRPNEENIHSAESSFRNAPEQNERTPNQPSHFGVYDEREASGQHDGHTEYQNANAASSGPEFVRSEDERFSGEFGGEGNKNVIHPAEPPKTNSADISHRDESDQQERTMIHSSQFRNHDGTAHSEHPITGANGGQEFGHSQACEERFSCDFGSKSSEGNMHPADLPKTCPKASEQHERTINQPPQFPDHNGREASCWQNGSLAHPEYHNTEATGDPKFEEELLNGNFGSKPNEGDLEQHDRTRTLQSQFDNFDGRDVSCQPNGTTSHPGQNHETAHKCEDEHPSDSYGNKSNEDGVHPLNGAGRGIPDHLGTAAFGPVHNYPPNGEEGHVLSESNAAENSSPPRVAKANNRDSSHNYEVGLRSAQKEHGMANDHDMPPRNNNPEHNEVLREENECCHDLGDSKYNKDETGSPQIKQEPCLEMIGWEYATHQDTASNRPSMDPKRPAVSGGDYASFYNHPDSAVLPAPKQMFHGSPDGMDTANAANVGHVLGFSDSIRPNSSLPSDSDSNPEADFTKDNLKDSTSVKDRLGSIVFGPVTHFFQDESAAATKKLLDGWGLPDQGSCCSCGHPMMSQQGQAMGVCVNSSCQNEDALNTLHGSGSLGCSSSDSFEDDPEILELQRKLFSPPSKEQSFSELKYDGSLSFRSSLEGEFKVDEMQHSSARQYSHQTEEARVANPMSSGQDTTADLKITPLFQGARDAESQPRHSDDYEARAEYADCHRNMESEQRGFDREIASWTTDEESRMQVATRNMEQYTAQEGNTGCKREIEGRGMSDLNYLQGGARSPSGLKSNFSRRSRVSIRDNGSLESRSRKSSPDGALKVDSNFSDSDRFECASSLSNDSISLVSDGVRSVTSDTMSAIVEKMQEAKNTLMSHISEDGDVEANIEAQLDMALLIQRLAAAAKAVNDLDASVRQHEQCRTSPSRRQSKSRSRTPSPRRQQAISPPKAPAFRADAFDAGVSPTPYRVTQWNQPSESSINPTPSRLHMPKDYPPLSPK